jgi:hypothetical protein
MRHPQCSPDRKRRRSLDAIASILLALRDPPACGRTASSPGAEGSPRVHMVRYFLLGRGDTAPVTREIIRE